MRLIIKRLMKKMGFGKKNDQALWKRLLEGFSPTSTSGGPRVFYLSPDISTPSWGIGMLYQHVSALNECGQHAFVLHHKRSFRLGWLDVDAPVQYLEDRGFRLSAEDILVVPEPFAMAPIFQSVQCRRLVFVQNAFYMLGNAGKTTSYRQLGYERAITVMPHLAHVIESFYDADADVIPVALASYFFISRASLELKNRRQQIVIYRKADSEDYEIVKAMLNSKLSSRFGNWELVELYDRPHTEVANILKQACFFVNVNCRESFNASVPEAMAAGCVCFCYEAFGGRDYLRDGKNAFVFKNNDVYPLLEKLFSVMEDFESQQELLGKIQQEAWETVQPYTYENLKLAVGEFYQRIV
jgi:hypothetical protein